MKQTLLAVSLLISTFIAAQFPVQIQPINTEFIQKVIREGDFAPYYASAVGILWNGQQSGGGMSSGVTGGGITGVTKAYYISSYTVTASKPILIQNLFGYYSSTGNYPVTGNKMIVGPSGVTINVNGIVRARMVALNTLTVIDVPEANPQSTAAYTDNNSVLVTKGQSTTVNAQRFTNVITATNSSGGTVTNLVVTDKLPIYYRYVSATGTNWTFARSNDTLTATYTGSIANAATVSYTMTGQCTVGIDIGLSINGYSIDNDVNLNAPPMYIDGTSISVGSGITDGRTSWMYLLRNWLRDVKATDVRVVNRSVSGTQTNIHEDFRAFDNRYDFTEPPKIFFEEHGINDVTQSIPTATSIMNDSTMVRHVRRKAPKCHIFILAPFPTANTTNEANLATLRTAKQAFYNRLTSAEQVYVHYVSATGTLWSPVTQDATYTTDGIHLNAAAMILVSNAIQTYITANNITF